MEPIGDPVENMDIEQERHLKEADRGSDLDQNQDQDQDQDPDDQDQDHEKNDSVQHQDKSEMNQSNEPETSEYKQEVNIAADEEDKDEQDSEVLEKNKEKQKPAFMRNSDNYLYFYKLPLLLVWFHKGLTVRAPLEHLRDLKQYIFEINVG